VTLSYSNPENVRVVIVDIYEPALAKGLAMMKSLGLEDRVTLIHADFFGLLNLPRKAATIFHDGGLSQSVDTILSNSITHVASLHACGTLSDAALQFAASSENCVSGAVVVPCCFAKSFGFGGAGWREVLGQLCAEASEEGAIPDEAEDKDPKVLGDTLVRLAEMNHTRIVSLPAMERVNELRLLYLRGKRGDGWRWWELRMDEAYTAKNILLCGKR
jgi:hypothetical protein